MARVLKVSSAREALEYLETVEEAGRRAMQALKTLTKSGGPLASLAAIKFEKVGFDPLDPDRPLNLIEQTNQTFTYVATLRGAVFLFERHPEAHSLTLTMGALPGPDIDSADCDGISAEVFAAVRPSNNNKLRSDIDKVAATVAANKYVLFMCPGIERGRHQVNHAPPGVQIYSLGAFDDAA